MIWIFLGNSMIIIFKKVAKTTCINDFSNRQHILKCFMIMMQHAYWLIGVKFSQLKITSVWRRSMDFKTAHAAVLSFLDYILQKGVKVNRYHVGSDESWDFFRSQIYKIVQNFYITLRVQSSAYVALSLAVEMWIGQVWWRTCIELLCSSHSNLQAHLK